MWAMHTPYKLVTTCTWRTTFLQKELDPPAEIPGYSPAPGINTSQKRIYLPALYASGEILLGASAIDKYEDKYTVDYISLGDHITPGLS